MSAQEQQSEVIRVLVADDPVQAAGEAGDFADPNAIKIAATLPLTAGSPDAGVADDW